MDEARTDRTMDDALAELHQNLDDLVDMLEVLPGRTHGLTPFELLEAVATSGFVLTRDRITELLSVAEQEVLFERAAHVVEALDEIHGRRRGIRPVQLFDALRAARLRLT